MTNKPVVLRERARRDVDEAIEHYLAEARSEVALAFIDTLEEAFRRMGEFPATGSPRYARELEYPRPAFVGRWWISVSRLLC